MVTIQYRLSIYLTFVVVFALLYGCGPAPDPVPATISLQSGNSQTAPARATLPKDIITTLSEASGLVSGDTGDILIEYVITKGGGSVSEPMATVRMPDVLGHRVQWTLGGFGENELQIKATWVSSSNVVSGSPIIVKANTETVEDVDQNIYDMVQIGDQIWMAENLKTTRYNDGSAVKHITDGTEWSNATSHGYCWYDNNDSNKNPYGALYNHYAVVNDKMCPVGWHVGTETDYELLVDSAGGYNDAGYKLKEAGNAHWSDNSTNSTNELLFTSVGTGERMESGGFNAIDVDGHLWTSTTNMSNEGVYFSTVLSIGSVGLHPREKKEGKGVRCMRDSI